MQSFSGNTVSVSLTFADAQEAAAFFAAYTRGKNTSADIAPATEPLTASEVKTKETAKQKDAAKKLDDGLGKAIQSVVEPATKGKAETIDRDAVSRLAVELAVKDKARVVGVLAQFDVKAVRDLPDEKLAELYQALKAALV